MQIEEFGIESKFMIAKNYVSVSQESKRRNLILNSYLDMIQRTFIAYRQFYEQIHDSFKAKIHEKNPYIGEFKDFIRSFSQLIKQTSIFQIDRITQIKITSEDLLSETTKDIVNRIQKFDGQQKKYRINLEQFHQIKMIAYDQFTQLKNQTKDPYKYFNPKHMQIKSKQLHHNVQQIKKYQDSLNKSKHQLSTNVFEFQRYLVNFRKKLLQNKYYALNKTIDHSKNFRDSMMEIMLFLSDCIQKKYQIFNRLIKQPNSQIQSSYHKKKKINQKQDVTVGIINSVQDYNYAIDQVDRIFKCLDNAFKNLNDKVAKISDNRKVFLQSLNNLYDLDQNPSKQVLQTLDLFARFTNKFCSLSDKMYQCTKQLMFLRSNVKKHSQVTLSLLRLKNSQKGPKVDQLFEQMNFEFIADILNEGYRSFNEIFIQIKSLFNQRYYKKKKHHIQNSMELSHFQDTVYVTKKKPCKKQFWLWRDWRDRINYTYQSASNFIQEIQGFLKTIQQPAQSQELKKYQCILNGKKDCKGVLKVCQKHLQFISLSSTSIDLIIPLNCIDGLQSKIKIFEKIMIIITNIGEILFSKFLDIQQAKQFIQDKIDAIGATNTNVNKKQSLKLSQGQIKFINERFQKIKQQRPSFESMNKVSERIIKGVTVDQVYETIYSDKTFTFRGKTQPTFFSYAMKKLKNLNYETTPYNTPGPQFYTSQKGINFQNCPLFSTRTIQYDHLLPPIPFMPKSCHNTEHIKLFWLSHQKFDYEAISQSSGAPYSDTFKCKILHQIQKAGDDVCIRIFTLFYFVKQTSMQGMLKSKGQKQMNENTLLTLDEIQRALKSLTGSSQQKQNNTQFVEDATDLKAVKTPLKTGSQMDKLKTQNKLLIGCLAIVILLNILLKVFMN